MPPSAGPSGRPRDLSRADAPETISTHAELPPSLGPLKVRMEGGVPVLLLPDDLPFADLREWVRERLPSSIDMVGGRASRLDLGGRDIQLFDLRRLLHLLRDEFSVDVTGLYVQTAAIHRYAERELKLKLFPLDLPVAAPILADSGLSKAQEGGSTLEGGGGRAGSGDRSENAKSPGAGSQGTTSHGTPATGAAAQGEPDLQIPGLADLKALLGESEPRRAEAKAEAAPEVFEPTEAVRRTGADVREEDGADGSRRTLTLRRTLRSGAAIHFDGDVTVVGDVNAGAQIRAGGNIIVLGKLRGVVHAGAQGDEDAFILAFDLAPTQLRVARHIAIAPARTAGEDSFHPEIATVSGGAIVIEPWKGRGRR